jgi:hypothetical protein
MICHSDPRAVAKRLTKRCTNRPVLAKITLHTDIQTQCACQIFELATCDLACCLLAAAENYVLNE